MSQALLAKGGLAVAGTALGGEGPSRDLALAALGVGAKYGVLMPFSRTQESEADVVGLRYMARAGFDPRAAVELWKNMQSTGSGGGQPEFASTHPSDESRIDDLQANMSSVLDTYQTARADGEAPNCEASSTWARR